MLNKDGTLNKRFFRACQVTVTAPDGKIFCQVSGLQLELFSAIKNVVFAPYAPPEQMKYARPEQSELPLIVEQRDAAAEKLERLQSFTWAARRALQELTKPDFAEWFLEQHQNVNARPFTRGSMSNPKSVTIESYLPGLERGKLKELFVFRLMRIEHGGRDYWRISCEASALNDAGFLQKYADEAAAGHTSDECLEKLNVCFDDDKQRGLF